MLRGAITAMSALALTIVPVAAQAAPQPISRASATTEDSESLTTTGWVLVGIGAALLIWGIIELTSDDEPESP
jgi:protein-S-isoprenylcysteine O-methyltransferase Ste14